MPLLQRFPFLYGPLTAFAILFASQCCAAVTTEFKSLVFDKGDCGSLFYRIPALTVASDGALIALADRRWDSLDDLPGKIDVVCRRSTDGGLTWSEYVTVAAADSLGGYGDPAVGIDPRSGDVVCVMTHGNGFWQSTPDNHARITVARSADGGLSWTHPEDITDMLYEGLRSAGVEPVSAFATSGALASTSDGALAFVLVVRDELKKWGKVKDFACISRDGGVTWKVAAEDADTDGNEAKIVELAKNKWLMSIRNRRKGSHKFSRSDDGGFTWSEPVLCDDIIEPSCNGDILRYSAPDGNVILLLSIPADAAQRRNVTLFQSDDLGTTWRPIHVLCPAPSAYSAMTLAPDGSLGCLVEEGACDGGWRIWFHKINLDTNSPGGNDK